jgi:diacylglycerol kinase family enzyme
LENNELQRVSVTVIMNREAGAAETRTREQEIAAAFLEHRLAPAIVVSPGKTIADAAQRAVQAGSRIVVAAGGDGTVNAVASAVAGTATILGVVPLGTLNHFAKDLGIPLDVPAAVATVAGGTTTAIDAAEVNARLFFNNASVGLYPRLVWERAREQQRGRRKWYAFLLALARVWRRYRRVTVSVHDGSGARVVHTPFVFVGNNEYLLEGVRIGGRARIDQGVLHVCMAPGLRRVDVMRILLAAIVGRLHAIDRFESVTTQQLSIAAYRRRLGVSLDGELQVLDTPLHFRTRPRALQVLVPRRERSA